MGGSEISDERKPRGDEIMIIANALREKFGGDAKTVARVQIKQASNEHRATWEGVLTELLR